MVTVWRTKQPENLQLWPSWGLGTRPRSPGVAKVWHVLGMCTRRRRVNLVALGALMNTDASRVVLEHMPGKYVFKVLLVTLFLAKG